MGDVVDSGIKFRYPLIVRGAEMYKQPKPSDEFVWAVCPFVGNTSKDGCSRCPSEEDDEHYGKVSRGCYLRASEICRVVFAMQKRTPP